MAKIIELLLVIGVLLIMLCLSFMALWEIDEERCYNMPLNRVYEDKLCQLHTQTYEEMNRR